MIQANELRIGNWIYIDNGEKPKYRYQITGHDIEEIEGDGTDCFRIPLTTEILERLGFANISRNEDGTYNFWSKELDASVDYEDEHLFRYRVHERLRTKNIMSVHELQNLHFALKGVELIVEGW